MKSGTESKSKFRQLKRRLKLRYWEVVGVLETLWRVTQADAPAGDIGRLDNEEIAAAMEWEGEPSALIDALVETHWVDLDDEFRLVIHDWSDHAPNHLVGAFSRYKKLFADQIVKQRNGITPKHIARDDAKDDAKEAAIAPCYSSMPKQYATNPSQAKPSLTKPNHPQTPSENPVVVAGGGEVWTIDTEAHARLALRQSGYKRYDELIGTCRDLGVTPQQIIEACKEYEANKDRLESPGAIAERLRSGYWPADGVVTPNEAIEKRASASQTKRKMFADSIRRRLIQDGENQARDWDDEKVIARGQAKGMIQ